MLLLFVLLQQGRVSGVARRRGAGSIGSASGRRSLAGPRAKRLPSRRVCCRDWCPVVSQGWRDAIAHSRAGVGALFVLHRARGDRGRARWWLRGAGDRTSAGSGPVDDLQRAATQRCDRTGRPEYRASTAQRHADRRARRPKPAKLVVNPELRAYVQDRLSGLCSGPTAASRALRSAGAGGVMGRARTGVGAMLEPGADLESTARGLPR